MAGAGRAGRVAVVTDSTSYLPDGLAGELGITVVPLHVVVGGVSGAEGVEVTPSDVARALSEHGGTVRTSRSAPPELVAAYRSCLAGGSTGVVSVHISAELSGTWESARLAAEECGGPSVVRVVDSRSTAMGLGFAAIGAAEAARDGRSLDEVHATAVAVAARTTCLFCVDTLEHLRRGGRVGTAQALLGTALSVKPILTVSDGRIVLAEKVRTASRGMARLAALAAQAAGESTVDLAVHHVAAAERAAALAEQLGAVVPKVRHLYRSEVGAAVAAHTGPGLLGVVVCPQ
jgi:DegV family protein with EDD domain